MLLFSLGLQDILEATRNANPEVRVVAYADDVYVQGPSAAVALAFRTLTRQARDIGLTARPDKCFASGPDAASAADVARMLRIPHADAGFVAGGVPLGSHTFVSDHLSSRADQVCNLITALLALPLPLQNQALILRSSLQARMAHFARAIPWSVLSALMAHVEVPSCVLQCSP
jgi:hypothetical protein